jgi:hypothetical protein
LVAQTASAQNGDGKLLVDIRGLVLNDASVGQSNGSPDGVDAVAVAVDPAAMIDRG